MNCLVVATRNRGKLKEIAALLNGLVGQVRCAADFPGLAETVEDGVSFEENALKKAREAMRHTGLPALADDSGLVVEPLNGRPGVHSARFAGDGATDADNNRRLLAELEGIPAGDRQAAFVCVMAYVDPGGAEQVFSGRVGGMILSGERGDGGFGYDPLFLVEGCCCTMAELPLEEKNRISHRGQALRQFRKYLEEKR